LDATTDVGMSQTAVYRETSQVKVLIGQRVQRNPVVAVKLREYARWDISGTRYQNTIHIHNVHGTKNPHHTNLLIETASIIVWLRREKRSFPLFFPKLLNYHVVSLS